MYRSSPQSPISSALGGALTAPTASGSDKAYHHVDTGTEPGLVNFCVNVPQCLIEKSILGPIKLPCGRRMFLRLLRWTVTSFRADRTVLVE
ncbi:hypothetical protein GLAREA_00352 [Glarea lozoyensis ATCC 20868]|uniref:Uncharacterized protein n=1 Tax=Glarea lozoyensis (strain ATCC 20868 / MF5171) TaxID=1116229 RepID=S3CRW0_GLAL2|nr:uncharacterized protein GLAREA_00352 [Glarea lozoyensis ATCC 20868]EPE29192.1 hypothetical protein GLAREA_00352 [Glarea lozoyensis ATCC 20868]